KSGGGTVSAVSAISFRSPPAQNALSPAPVSTRTLAVSSSLKRRTPSYSPSRTAALSALRASGRSMVSQATPPSTRYLTVSVIGRPGAYADEQMRALTYRQADQAANQVAHALLASGLERGDVVLMFCENSVEAYLAKIGIAKAGLVAAPLNPMMAPDLVAAMIDLVRPKLAIVDAELWPRAQEPFTAKGL